MSQSLLFAFIVFAVVMFITPGPNNIMVLSSGLIYGFRRTLPHIAGVTVGVAFMVGAVGVGLGAVFIAYPALQTILKYLGVASGRHDRDVRTGRARPGGRPRPDDVLGRGHVPMG